MRKVLWTVFLVVALQGIAAAATSTAFASPASEQVATTETVSAQDRPTRLEASELRIQSSSRAEGERKPTRTQPEVLSRNFANPKPVRIYWFFGGR